VKKGLLKIFFVFGISIFAYSDLLKPSLTLQTEEKDVLFYPSINLLKKRIFNNDTDPLLEPVFIKAPTTIVDLQEFSANLATYNKEKDLFHYISSQFNKDDLTRKYVKVKVDKKLWKMSSKKQLKKLFAATHKKVNILTKNSSRENLLQLLAQTKMFLSSKNRKKIISQIKRKRKISLDKYLLPKFPKTVLKGFSLYRGPNCFHASMAFHSNKFAHSNFYNVKRERNHHSIMINNDELYRTLRSEFYEITLNGRNTLRYGDVVIFLELPRNISYPEHEAWFHYKWIKHAAVFLFNDYTFSKQSKSSNSPYSVKRLSDEKKYWFSRLKSPAIKIFRRSQKHVRKIPSKNQADWMY
jgi:hypothetical protein